MYIVNCKLFTVFCHFICIYCRSLLFNVLQYNPGQLYGKLSGKINRLKKRKTKQKIKQTTKGKTKR